jgi:hypothetical protein
MVTMTNTSKSQSVDELVNEASAVASAKSTKSSAELTDELPKEISAAYGPISKKVYLNRSIAAERRNDVGGNRLSLAHEYTHMLFDLLLKEQDKIVEIVANHSNYSQLKEFILDNGWGKGWEKYKNKATDKKVVGEILAIRSDFKRRAAYERAVGNNIPFVDYFLELVDPIAAGYIDSLGFDKPVSAAKAKRMEIFK